MFFGEIEKFILSIGKKRNLRGRVYIHFQKRGFLPVYDDCEISEESFITNTGFYPLENITIDIIRKYNPYRSFLFEKNREVY